MPAHDQVVAYRLYGEEDGSSICPSCTLELLGIPTEGMPDPDNVELVRDYADSRGVAPTDLRPVDNEFDDLFVISFTWGDYLERRREGLPYCDRCDITY